MTKTETVLQENYYSKTVQYTISDEYGTLTATQEYAKVYYMDQESKEIDFYLKVR